MNLQYPMLALDALDQTCTVLKMIAFAHNVRNYWLKYFPR